MNKDKSIVTISEFFKVTSSGAKLALYECYCGKIFACRPTSLLNGNTKSCGCYRKELNRETATKHGMRKFKEYRIWQAMKDRCLNDKCKDYIHYGARGITVSEDWLAGFENFYRDMGPRPDGSYTIERIDNNKGYSKENCKWATRKEQSNNNRLNVLLTCQGKTQNISQWAEEIGIKASTLQARLSRYGWSVEEALGFKARQCQK